MGWGIWLNPRGSPLATYFLDPPKNFRSVAIWENKVYWSNKSAYWLLNMPSDCGQSRGVKVAEKYKMPWRLIFLVFGIFYHALSRLVLWRFRRWSHRQHASHVCRLRPGKWCFQTQTIRTWKERVRQRITATTSELIDRFSFSLSPIEKCLVFLSAHKSITKSLFYRQKHTQQFLASPEKERYFYSFSSWLYVWSRG